VGFTCALLAPVHAFSHDRTVPRRNLPLGSFTARRRALRRCLPSTVCEKVKNRKTRRFAEELEGVRRTAERAALAKMPC
jgi:hypothetical protein